MRNIPRQLAVTDDGKYYPILITIEGEIVVEENQIKDGEVLVAVEENQTNDGEALAGGANSALPMPASQLGGKGDLNLIQNLNPSTSWKSVTEGVACSLRSESHQFFSRVLDGRKGKEAVREEVEYQSGNGLKEGRGFILCDMEFLPRTGGEHALEVGPSEGWKAVTNWQVIRVKGKQGLYWW